VLQETLAVEKHAAVLDHPRPQAAMDGLDERVVLLAETPFLNFDPIDCLADPEVETCDPPTQIVIDREYAQIEADAAAAADATLLSINDLLCPGAVCPVVVDGTVVFRDQHHLTATYMAKLAQPISNLLEGRPAYPSPSPTAGAVAPTSAPVAAPASGPASSPVSAPVSGPTSGLGGAVDHVAPRERTTSE
jgi:hypothetical protein